MKATEILSIEHRVIETMLTVLERICQDAESNHKLNKEDAQNAVSFIRTFADQCHHGKEEGQLFPAMEAKGIPAEHGPIGVMLNEHEQGRQFVRGMAGQIELAAQGDSSAIRTFTENAHGYVFLLRSHIQKEDNILFPMAARVMNEEEQAVLLKQFDLVETDHMGAGTHEKFLAMAEALATKYGVSTEKIAAAASCGCSHHKH
ncbi:MAG: hemerythrin domain-containing protein [candidate division Zixibacteria bacterium]|nr:hemerythrin domain-containing protein [candidate division Zixibacteria bacterium]